MMPEDWTAEVGRLSEAFLRNDTIHMSMGQGSTSLCGADHVGYLFIH